MLQMLRVISDSGARRNTCAPAHEDLTQGGTAWKSTDPSPTDPPSSTARLSVEGRTQAPRPQTPKKKEKQRAGFSRKPKSKAGPAAGPRVDDENCFYETLI